MKYRDTCNTIKIFIISSEIDNTYFFTNDLEKVLFLISFISLDFKQIYAHSYGDCNYTTLKWFYTCPYTLLALTCFMNTLMMVSIKILDWFLRNRFALAITKFDILSFINYSELLHKIFSCASVSSNQTRCEKCSGVKTFVGPQNKYSRKQQ